MLKDWQTHHTRHLKTNQCCLRMQRLSYCMITGVGTKVITKRWLTELFYFRPLSKKVYKIRMSWLAEGVRDSNKNKFSRVCKVTAILKMMNNLLSKIKLYRELYQIVLCILF